VAPAAVTVSGADDTVCTSGDAVALSRKLKLSLV
jgi:hypothetical protein